MYYTIYKTTNKINGKIYIGSHKTENLDDNYMGSGKYLKYAIEKHGIENFDKEILFVYDNAQDMWKKEAELVTVEFIAEENTYNLKVGGFGGWDWINENGIGQQAAKLGAKQSNISQRYLRENDPEWVERCKIKRSIAMKKAYEEGKLVYTNPLAFKGKTHTEETKRRIGEKNSKHQTGEGNSQYGTRWIHSLELKQSKRIKKDEPLPDGWVEGRKMKF